jgi:hypothetical protein
LNAIARALEALEEVKRAALDLEADDEEPKTPPNVQRDATKTGPRTPFRGDPPSSGYQTPTTFPRVVRHVVSAWEVAVTEAEREGVKLLMRKIVEQKR